MSVSLISALGFDQEPLDGQCVLVEESRISDASFIISTLIEHESKRNIKIILVLFHNSIGHYHSIGLKLGFNLFAMQQSGQVVVVDVLQHITSSVFVKESSEDLKIVYDKVKDSLTDAKHCIIVENVSNLLLLDHSMSDVLELIQLLLNCNNCSARKDNSVVLTTHRISNNETLNQLCTMLKYLCNVVIEVKDLTTGRAVDVSGTLVVHRIKKQTLKWNQQNEYHFQLLEKNINVFAPGLKNS